MQTMRKRVPFTFKSEDGSDEQQRNATSNKQNRIALQAMLCLSGLLHIIYLFSDRRSPLFAIFPSSSHDQASNVPLAFSGIFSYIAILVHVNLGLIIHPYHITVARWTVHAIGFAETLAWSAIGPCVSIFLRKTWQTTLWWSISAVMTVIVYAAHGWIQKVDEDVTELEKLQYQAAGA
ncbi:hypothetical protein ID866_1446 [Astraeus odoratus]|nr:hypothetical protein ID866_1446 [Astraeus odoratus]